MAVLSLQKFSWALQLSVFGFYVSVFVFLMGEEAILGGGLSSEIIYECGAQGQFRQETWTPVPLSVLGPPLSEPQFPHL